MAGAAPAAAGEPGEALGRPRNLVDLWFASFDLPEDHPLLVFQHVHRAGGASLRRVIEVNVEEGGGEVRSVPVEREAARERALMRAWWERLHEGLSRDERARLIGAGGHSAAYLAELTGRPWRGAVLIRDPIERLLSRCHYYTRASGRTVADLCRSVLSEGPHEAELDRSVASELIDPDAGLFRPPAVELFNGQARSLLEAGCDTGELRVGLEPPDDADRWRERLFRLVSERYTVGTQDRFAESVEVFARVFRWSRERTPRLEENPDRAAEPELSADDRDLILACNWLDRELYEQFAAPLAPAGAAPDPVHLRLAALEERFGVLEREVGSGPESGTRASMAGVPVFGERKEPSLAPRPAKPPPEPKPPKPAKPPKEPKPPKPQKEPKPPKPPKPPKEPKPPKPPKPPKEPKPGKAPEARKPADEAPPEG